MNLRSEPTRRNLERKARCPDLAAAADAVRQLDTTRAGVQLQTDTYFHVKAGRLKLRVIAGQPAVLIWYERPNEFAIRLSRYHLVPAPDPDTLLAALTAALGVRGEVRKRRTIHHYHNVRIHLDEVEGLGTFVEFEAVLSVADGETVSRQRLDDLGRVLKLGPAQDVEGSYADLLGI